MTDRVLLATAKTIIPGSLMSVFIDLRVVELWGGHKKSGDTE
jgi:hypothetical protein